LVLFLGKSKKKQKNIQKAKKKGKRDWISPEQTGNHYQIRPILPDFSRKRDRISPEAAEITAKKGRKKSAFFGSDGSFDRCTGLD